MIDVGDEMLCIKSEDDWVPVFTSGKIYTVNYKYHESTSYPYVIVNEQGYKQPLRKCEVMVVPNEHRIVAFTQVKLLSEKDIFTFKITGKLPE